MKIGIRAHDLKSGEASDVFATTKEHGFDYIQLVFKKALKDKNNNPLLFNVENATDVKTQLDKHDIKVCMLGAYFNPVHSNKQLVKQNVEYFKEHLKYAHILNCQYVGTETGSYNDDSWTYNPKNQTKQGYDETLSVFKELIKCASEYKTTILMEPAYGHVIYSVDVLKKAVDEINSPYLKVTIDIYNLLYIGNYKEYKEIFTHALKTFNEDIKIIHLKDFNVCENRLVQCGLGKGIIDFSFIVSNVKKYCPNAVMVFEGVVGQDILTSHELINSLI